VTRDQGDSWLDRAKMRVVALTIVTGGALLANSSTLHVTSGPLWPTALGLLITVGAALRVIIEAFRPGGQLSATRWLAYGALATNVVLVIWGAPQTPKDAAPWAIHLTVLGLTSAPVAFPRRPRAVVVALLATTHLLLRLKSADGVAPVLETVIPVVGSLAIGALLSALNQAFAAAREAQEQVAAIAEAEAAQREQELQRQWWDLLVHDRVLAALLMGSRATTLRTLATARALAVEALEALEGRSDRELTMESFPERVVSFGRTVGVDVEASAEGVGTPDDVLGAMWGAVQEAILNVAKHSGVRSCVVSLKGSAESATVDVTDEGRGFVLSEVPDERIGVRRSLPGHLALVGGSAEVESLPGSGTRVRLEWSRSSAAPHRAVVLDPARLMPYPWLIPAWVTLHAALGLQLTHVVTSWPAAIAGMLLIALGSALVVRNRVRRYAATAVACLLSGLALSVSAVTSAPYSDFRLWACGAVAPATLLMVMSGSVRLAGTLAIGGFAVVIALVGHQGDGYLRGALEASGQLPILYAIGVIVGRSFERATNRLRSANDRRIALIASREASAARMEEGNRRRALLSDTALPLLRQLVAEPLITQDTRMACRAVEATTRDHLLASVILDERVERAVADARQRGAKVILGSADHTVHPSSAGKLTELRSALVALLEHAGEGSQVRARWTPGDPRWVGTIAAERLSLGATWTGSLSGAASHRFDVDEDTVWMEIH
jgi:hypothetical protein